MTSPATTPPCCAATTCCSLSTSRPEKCSSQEPPHARPDPGPPKQRATCSYATPTASPVHGRWSEIVAASSSTRSTRSPEAKASRFSRLRSERRSRTRSLSVGSGPFGANSSTAPFARSTTATQHQPASDRRPGSNPPSSRQINPMPRPHPRIQKRRITRHDRVSGTHSPSLMRSLISDRLDSPGFFCVERFAPLRACGLTSQRRTRSGQRNSASPGPEADRGLPQAQSARASS